MLLAFAFLELDLGSLELEEFYASDRHEGSNFVVNERTYSLLLCDDQLRQLGLLCFFGGVLPVYTLNHSQNLRRKDARSGRRQIGLIRRDVLATRQLEKPVRDYVDDDLDSRGVLRYLEVRLSDVFFRLLIVKVLLQLELVPDRLVHPLAKFVLLLARVADARDVAQGWRTHVELHLRQLLEKLSKVQAARKVAHIDDEAIVFEHEEFALSEDWPTMGQKVKVRLLLVPEVWHFIRRCRDDPEVDIANDVFQLEDRLGAVKLSPLSLNNRPGHQVYVQIVVVPK